MATSESSELENFREYLGLLGRMQLNENLKGKVDVSGVVQLTFLEALESKWDLLPEKQQLPWLRKIFANNLLDEIRKFRAQARDIRREQSLVPAIEQSATGIHQFLKSDESSPSQKAMRVEDQLRVAKALACLSEPQREAIEMHHLKGMNLADISEHMGKDKGAVASLIYRGTKKLRTLLTQDKASEYE